MLITDHEIDTVIRHSLGGAVALSLENNIKKKITTLYGIVQSKTFGAPTASGNLGNRFGKICKSISKNEIIAAGTAGGIATGGSADSAIGFSDGGLLTGLSADIGKKVSTDMANRLTSDNNTSPDRMRYFGGPTSFMDMNATTVMPSFKQRFNNSAHSYSGLFIKDAVPVHDVEKNTLQYSPDDKDAEAIAY